MSDQPRRPIGFSPEFLPYPINNDPLIPPQYYSGAALSYPMPQPQQQVPSSNIYPDINNEVEQKKLSSSSSSSSSSTTTDNNEAIKCYSNELDYLNFESFGYSWQHLTTDHPFPTELAVRAGRDSDGSVIYVGRAFHEGDMIPAKVIPEKNAAYVSYGGEEILKTEFEILRTGNFVWEFATNGDVPSGAIEIGRTADGEKLFMGRCLYNGSQTPGKVQMSHGCLYIPFDGEEVSQTEYEVLVLK